jgi:hypothetical protein
LTGNACFADEVERIIGKRIERRRPGRPWQEKQLRPPFSSAERRGISADTALRLARYFGTTAEYWMILQKAYELRLAEQTLGKTIQKTVKPRAA